MTSQVDLDDLESARKWDAEQVRPKGRLHDIRAVLRGLLVGLLRKI